MHNSIIQDYIQQGTTVSKHISTDFLVPTSNDLERPFSQVKRLLGPQRRSLGADTLKNLLMLSQNSQLWNQMTVAQVTNKISEDPQPQLGMVVNLQGNTLPELVDMDEQILEELFCDVCVSTDPA